MVLLVLCLLKDAAGKMRQINIHESISIQKQWNDLEVKHKG